MLLAISIFIALSKFRTLTKFFYHIITSKYHEFRKEQKLEAFSKLLLISWTIYEKNVLDKKQDLQSLRHLTLEEVYELSDALLEENLTEIKKELKCFVAFGFYAKIGSEKKSFDIADVINSLNEKLIFRHPHIYGNVEVKDEEEVKQNWEKLKLKEGNKSILAGVPKKFATDYQKHINSGKSKRNRF